MTERQQRLNLPFTGIPSFCRFPVIGPEEPIDADVVVFGAPVDITTQYRPGARFGPRGIRDASMLFPIGPAGAYDPERDETFLGPPWKIVDGGDADLVHGDLAQNLASIRAGIARIVDAGAMPVTLGGDHCVTIPVLEALAPRGPFAVIQIDAHLDFVDERMGQRYGQGSPMRRASEMAHVTGAAQLGIRGLGSSSRTDFEDARAAGNLILSPREIRARGIDAVIAALPDAERYYVTIDIDGMDAAIAPGTGTPSPGGLQYEEAQLLLEGVAGRGEIVGMDMVEVAPDYDPTGITAQLAARMIVDLLGFALKARENAGMKTTHAEAAE